MNPTAPLPDVGGGAVLVSETMKKEFEAHRPAARWLAEHGEVLRYLFFGVLTTLLNILLYGLFLALFGYQAANSWGNVLDNALCILFAYATNRAFVFRSRARGRAAAAEFGKFVACRLGTMALDTAVMIAGGNWLAAPGAALVGAVLGRWLGPSQAQALWGLGVKVFSNGLVILLNYLYGYQKWLRQTR